MKLRYFTAAMTEIVAGTAVVAGMWIWTRADVLEILFMVLLVSPLAGLAVLAWSEPKPHKRKSTSRGKHWALTDATELAGGLSQNVQITKPVAEGICNLKRKIIVPQIRKNCKEVQAR